MKKLTTLSLCLLLTHVAFAQLPDSSSGNLASQLKTLTETVNAVNQIKTAVNQTDVSAQKQEVANARTELVFTSKLDSLRKDGTPLYTDSILVPKNRTDFNYFQAIVSLLLLLALFYYGNWLANKTSLCRDECYHGNYLIHMDKEGPYYTDNNGKKQRDGVIKPSYSYSRIQLFWWTMIILGTYIVFFGLTGCLLPLNATAVILLGLGLGVLASGKLIDKGEIKDDTIPLGSRSQDKKESGNSFFTDIISDEKGESLHRFQAVVFNAIFGIGFVGYFFKSVALHQYPFPDFNEWQFALMGVSASAYLIMKTAENKPANGATPPPPPPASDNEGKQTKEDAFKSKADANALLKGISITQPVDAKKI